MATCMGEQTTRVSRRMTRIEIGIWLTFVVRITACFCHSRDVLQDLEQEIDSF